MQSPTIKTLFAHNTKAVLAFESNDAPDVLVLRLLKKLAALKQSPLKHVIVVCDFSFMHKRLTHQDELQVLFSFKKCKKSSPSIQKNQKKKTFFEIEKICIQQKPSAQRTSFAQFENEFTDARENKIIFNMHDLFQLIPVFIPKPWGQEIWYSGIEARGVAKMTPLLLDPAVKPRDDRLAPRDDNSIPVSSRGASLSSRGLTAGSIPLSWIAGAVPTLLFGKKFAKKDPVLIKILDPLPDEVKGDLYYELHREKNEVYVVTDVADTCGQIKIGTNAQKLKLYDGDQKKYKHDFLKSILAYEKIRRQIDNLKDSKKCLPDTLLEQETALRKEMDSFCGFLDLNIGDVINVPVHIPHALQHGVKVIEFQTPTYERLIISFAQKVLTQTHWDTKEAFDFIKITPFQKQPLQTLSKTKNLLKELVCEFPDFKVSRWTLEAHSKCEISGKTHYTILFMVKGKALPHTASLKTKKQKNTTLIEGMCVLIPQNTPIVLTAKAKSVLLMCTPN